MASRKIRNIFIIFIMIVTGNIYAGSAVDYELTSGYLKLQIFPSTGSFCLYAFSDNDRYVPLYDDRMNGRSNEFFVNYNGKIYQLRNRGKNSFFIKRDIDSIRVTHIYENKFFVIQDFSFIEEKFGESGALLKIETTIKNINEERADIGFKALIDTKLGERKERMFLTDMGRFFVSETILDPKFENATALISRGTGIDCVFLLKHNQATVADKIFIANRSWLKSDLWKPKMVKGRSFNTRYSHNDSAVLFFWDTERKSTNEEFFVSMVIGYDRLTNMKINAEFRNKPVNKEKKSVVYDKSVKSTKKSKYVKHSKSNKQPKFVKHPKPIKQPKFAEQPEPIEQPKFVEQPKPIEPPKFVKQPEPIEPSKSVEPPNPTPPSKTVEEPEAIEPSRPAARTKLIRSPKPVVQSKPIDEEQLRKIRYIKELLEKIGKTEEDPYNYSIEELEALVNEVDGFVDTEEVPETYKSKRLRQSERIMEGAER